MILMVLLFWLGPVGMAQPIKPVFTSTSLDGQLVGFETDLQFGIWRPIAALAYGVDSGNFRYKVGLRLMAGFDLPAVGGRLEDFSAAWVDWPESPVLGREGQSGVEVGWRLGNTHFSNFIGTLWTREGDAPQIQYIAVDTFDSYPLPFGLQLSSASQAVLGMILPSEATFQSMTRTLTLSAGGLRLSGRWGMLENPAQLGGFEFTTGVRGIAQALKGDQFWNVTLERTFSMHESAIPLSIPPEWQMLLPASVPFRLQGAFFVQAGGANGNASQTQEDDMLFSWGVSATMSLGELKLRAELIFSQYGDTTFHFGF